MKRLILLLGLPAVATLLLPGCGSHNGSSAAVEEAEIETAALGILSETAASDDSPESERDGGATGASWQELTAWSPALSPDSSRRFVRTAAMKFRVKHLATSIYSIEEIVRQQGGYVQSSRLRNTVLSTESTPVSRDSLLETTTHRLSCTLILRIPAERLDTSLQLIANHIDFLDSRTVEVEDVTLDEESYRLTGERYRKYAPDLKRQARRDTSTDALFKRSAQSDEAMLQLKRLNDRIRFSTVTLTLYQRETTQHTLLPQSDAVRAYRPGFWTEAGQALSRGLTVLKVIVLFFLHIWWLLAGGAIVWGVLYLRKRFKRGNKKKKTA